MKNIILVRHTNAEEISSQNDDFHRVITNKGIEKAITMASEFKKVVTGTPAIISSSAARSLQTAEIFSNAMGIPANKIIKREFLYHYYTFEQLIDFLSGMKPETIMLFGHNPMMSDTASQFSIKCFESFPKCTVTGFSFDVKDFSEIKSNSGKLMFYLKP